MPISNNSTYLIANIKKSTISSMTIASGKKYATKKMLVAVNKAAHPVISIPPTRDITKFTSNSDISSNN